MTSQNALLIFKLRQRAFYLWIFGLGNLCLRNKNIKQQIAIINEGVAGLVTTPKSPMDRFLGFEQLGSLHDRYQGVGPGFDFLRLFLAILIFYSHTGIVLPHAGPMPANIGDALESDLKLFT
ncbi:MAG: hypothetical protein QM488_00120 [Rhizobiaceae bacterium]